MTPETIRSVIETNLRDVRGQIAAAQARSENAADVVQVVAVTKYANWDWVQALSSLHDVFGENRPQQLAERQNLMPRMQWHLIGQLQRNKARLAVSHASVIHSIDSIRLLARIVEIASENRSESCPSLLLQVNVTGEASKSGFSPDELRSTWDEILAFSGSVPIVGLMTMAEDTDDPGEARPAFTALRLLRDELAERSNSSGTALPLPHLSMGMSGDFVPAVEEGATLVRIGSRLFQGLE
ncbi:MAG: YggS family pyridoxal phosphate-dependent enzyme [Planctomycetaceae bacterium]|nr:YggS family pyridoxal phosphate-dependent enzyme [Planctomycetaceae bacterium]